MKHIGKCLKTYTIYAFFIYKNVPTQKVQKLTD